MSTSNNPKTSFLMPDSNVTVTPSWEETSYFVITSDGTLTGLSDYWSSVHNEIELKELTIPDGVKAIGSKAWERDGGSTYIINIPASVTSIASDAFQGCYELMNININKPRESIAGAPWGRTPEYKVEVKWLG